MKKIIIASGPVIVENNKVLLDQQGEDNFWKFCGGKIRENEDLKQTAIRRSKEELEIDIEIINDNPFIMYVSKKDGVEEIDVILVHWLAKRKGEPKIGEDVKRVDWLDVNNLPDSIGPNVKPVLKHFGFIEE